VALFQARFALCSAQENPMLFALDSNRSRQEPIDDGVDELAMNIFTEIAAHYTVRHGVHEIRTQAPLLARESFKLAETFVQEREARRRGDKDRA
jgi:hypothetical protein